MRKEIIWAAAIGITFGLIIAFGVYRINSAVNKKAETTTSTPKPNKNGEFKITLDKPQNADVITENSVTVSGITKPLTWVTISGEDDDYIIQADEEGVFIQDANLIPGVNQIKITAFDPQGNESTEKVIVVYSSSFKPLTVPTPNPSNTSSDSAIRAKVEQKVSEALNKPKAYIGTVTDITNSTIQIKSIESQISQISVGGDGISVVKTAGAANKTVKLTDIAIGDFIVAMGYVNSSSVLSAQRILITNPITEPKIISVLARVKNVSKKSIDITTLKSSATDSLTTDSKTEVKAYLDGKLSTLKMASLTTGDVVIYIKNSSSSPGTIRAIFVVQKAPQS